MEKYYGQQCQDEVLNKKFRELHHKLVNEIIAFCKENDIEIDEFHLNADGVEGSIPYGQWEACTDSCLSFEKFSEDYKAVINFDKLATDKEWRKIKSEQQPFLVSM